MSGTRIRIGEKKKRTLVVAKTSATMANPNAVQQALDRADPQQRARNEAAIEEARRTIRLVSMQQMDDITPSGAESIARNAQIIEEAKRNIPFETMQDVNEVAPPGIRPANSSSLRGFDNLQPSEQTQATIHSIEQGEGNNYLQGNAVDRAQARQPQEMQVQEPQRVNER
jgi:hypothetical protein